MRNHSIICGTGTLTQYRTLPVLAVVSLPSNEKQFDLFSDFYFLLDVYGRSLNDDLGWDT